MSFLEVIAYYTDQHYLITITNVNPNFCDGHFMRIELAKNGQMASKYIHPVDILHYLTEDISDLNVEVRNKDNYMEKVFKELATEVDNKIVETESVKLNS